MFCFTKIIWKKQVNIFVDGWKITGLQLIHPSIRPRVQGPTVMGLLEVMGLMFMGFTEGQVTTQLVFTCIGHTVVVILPNVQNRRLLIQGFKD
jgi:hypothetical protein